MLKVEGRVILLRNFFILFFVLSISLLLEECEVYGLSEIIMDVIKFKVSLFFFLISLI